MDTNLIAFIVTCHDERKYGESELFIRSLEVPQGYNTEIVKIAGSSNVAGSYNKGMIQTNAKYKVYLPDHTLLVNRGMLREAIDLFEKDATLGIIGASGNSVIPTNGLHSSENQRRGQLYARVDGVMQAVHYPQTSGDLIEVQGVDGYLLITQYDVTWREDLACDQETVGFSQAQEFIRTGYRAGIAPQNQPWCLFDDGMSIAERDNRQSVNCFYAEYIDEIRRHNSFGFPLVSILLPTSDRPNRFEESLNSVLGQTYENLEILVCDTSERGDHGPQVEQWVGRFPQVKFVACRQEGLAGIYEMVSHAKGEFISLLTDRDVFVPSRTEKMMRYFRGDRSTEIAMISSQCHRVDEEGNEVGPYNTIQAFNRDVWLDGAQILNHVLSVQKNWYCHTSSFILRKKLLNERLFSSVGDAQKNIGLALFAEMAQFGNVLYMPESLSSVATVITSSKEEDAVLEQVEFAAIALKCRQLDLIETELSFENIVKQWLKSTETILPQAVRLTGRSTLLNRLWNTYKEMKRVYDTLTEAKFDIAQRHIEEHYRSDENNLIIFLVPGKDFITGGIRSIYSIYGESRKLKHIHDSEVIMCTLPNDPFLLHNENFENEVTIHPFEICMKYFNNLKKVIVHIPEIYVGRFSGGISSMDKLYLKSLPSLQLNILLQNIDYTPSQKAIAELLTFTPDVTCTTAHERYSTKEVQDRLGIKLHYLSTGGNPNNYKISGYRDKENIMVVSPDLHPMKDRILKEIQRQFPDLEQVIIQNMKYEDYKKLIARAKWSITFGEGQDAYLMEPVFSGSVGFAVYNTNFFQPGFKGLPTIFESYELMLVQICERIRMLDEEQIYSTVNRELYELSSKVKKFHEYIENLHNFYKKDYRIVHSLT